MAVQGCQKADRGQPRAARVLAGELSYHGPMASVILKADTAQVSRLATTMAALIGQHEWICARAMTNGVKASREAIRREIFPLVEGGPTRWTERGLIARYARRDDLRAAVGFNYDQAKQITGVIEKLSDSGRSGFKGGGVPSGRYMEINVRGGDRNPKGFELEMRRSGAIRRGAFVVPNRNLKEIDKHGNLPAKFYTQIGSRIRGLDRLGSGQNAPQGAGSRGRTARKRAVADYFILYVGEDGRPTREPGATPLAIVRRTGFKNRGFEPVLWLVDDAPNYERKFPVQSVAWREFSRIFPIEYEKGLEDALRRRGL